LTAVTLFTFHSAPVCGGVCYLVVGRSGLMRVGWCGCECV